MSYPPVPTSPGTPQRSSSRTTRIVLTVLAALLLLCCIGGVGGGFWFYNALKDATGPARDAVSAYLDDTRAGDHAAAYTRLCERERRQVTVEAYAQQQADAPRIDSYRITGTDIANRNGHATGTVRVKVTEATGSTRGYIYPLVREDGEWRICPE